MMGDNSDEETNSLTNVATEQASSSQILHGIQPLIGLDLKSRLKAENWMAYKQRWENYSIVAQLNNQSEEY